MQKRGCNFEQSSKALQPGEVKENTWLSEAISQQLQEKVDMNNDKYWSVAKKSFFIHLKDNDWIFCVLHKDGLIVGDLLLYICP